MCRNGAIGFGLPVSTTEYGYFSIQSGVWPGSKDAYLKVCATRSS
jgi:hypothetical protein